MSRVVFVGNVPYNMGEEQLIDVFKTVGHVVGFRLVYDRETSKPRGYGFCEFGDHETAQSAVRNLNGKDVGGRPLRIDLADSDPFLEGRTTTRGELLDGIEIKAASRERELRSERTPDILASLPPGVPVPPGMTSMDVITQALTTIRPSQMLDVLAQMKTYVTNYPVQARDLLSHNPQLACALFQALILNEIVDRSVIDRMQAAANATMAAKTVHSPLPPQMATHVTPMPQVTQHVAQYPQYTSQLASGLGMNPPMAAPHQQPAYMTPHIAAPLPSSAPLSNPYYRPPPPTAPAPVPAPSASVPDAQAAEQQRAMLMQVLALTPEQINALPAGEKAVVEQLRSQLYGALQHAQTT